MAILFGQVLNMSLSASFIILCILAARLLLKKAPKIYSYALWAVVLFRLLCPVSIASDVSVLELTQPEVMQSEAVSYVTYTPVENVLIESGDVLPKVQSEPIAVQELEQAQKDTTPSVMEIISYVWVAGIAVMLLNSMVAYLRLYRSLVGAMQCSGNVYLADHITSPFVLGTLFPKIYLPSDTPVEERRYIIAHERHHIRRFDHIIKLLAYAALCIHWFNPLVWASFLLAGKDMEMSCDEAVIKRLGEHIRADYSASLLRLATHKKIISGTPLAFGEGDTKGRVRNMAKWKRPKVWISILCVVLCIVVIAVCAVNPQGETEDKELAAETVETQIFPFRIYQYQLPKGYSYGTDENQNICFTDGNNTIGGIVAYSIPVGVYDPNNRIYDWLGKLGIPDYEEEGLCYTGGSSKYGDWEMHFESDVPPGTEKTIDRYHTFFITEDTAYDVWFDLMLISSNTREEILDAIQFGSVCVGSIPPGYSIQIGQFPEGYTYEMDGYGNVLFMNGSDTIGGLTSYAIPEGVYDPDVSISHWLQDVGIPDYEDSSLKYLGGMSFFDDEWGAEFASNVPEGVEPTVYRKHSFRMIGDRVFDYWFDLLKIDWDTCMDIRDAVQILDNTESSPMEQGNKCRAVLKAVQTGSSHILLERHYDADTGPSDYTQEYLQHQNQNHNEWLSTITVQIAGKAEKHANLYANGTYFSNMGKWSEEELLWTEMKTEAKPLRPWLTSYQWNEETVAYMDTLPDGSGECIMLRIDEPFVSGTEETGDHYFVNFYFDSEGSFVKVEITVDLFLEDEFTQTESIVTLENLWVFNEIDKEYQRAIAS